MHCFADYCSDADWESGYLRRDSPPDRRLNSNPGGDAGRMICPVCRKNTDSIVSIAWKGQNSMEKMLLRDGWHMTVLGENVYGIEEKPLDAKVPGTVYSTLLDHGLMPDPFVRDNELDALKLMDNDFLFETKFALSEQMLGAQRLLLCFEGIDTLADITLNGEKIASVDNMHRTWEFDVTKLAAADNDLRLLFHSPTKFIEMADKAHATEGSAESMRGFPQLRKAACMFGWDWGPRLPDAGLFRDVYVLAYDEARIQQVYVTQQHQVTGHDIHGDQVSAVKVQVHTEIERTKAGQLAAMLQADAQALPDVEALLHNMEKSSLLGQQMAVQAVLTSPDGESVQSYAFIETDKKTADLEITVEDPQRWWPNGYGSQPLYEIEVTLLSGDDLQDALEQAKDKASAKEQAAEGKEAVAGAKVLDTWQRRIGLRTVTVNLDPMPDEVWDEHLTGQTPDEIPGRNFALTVNGLQIFAMGADYIPEDNILPRVTGERTRRLLEDAAKCYHNTIRVWGGGYFLDDFFYDICDELGLLVWQDMMFACANYELMPGFDENIRAEIRDNVRRLRHHACIGLWCGNNELETMVLDGCFAPITPKQKADYLHMAEYIEPQVIRQEDPQGFYWPSSPSSGGNFDHPQAENVGDTHYWGVWHGSEPFTAYRSHHYRFLSEFGFQSFPCLQSVEEFTDPGDRNIFSRVMEMHQRNNAANGKILSYMSMTYLYPKDFDQLLFCSQILQADAIRYGVEHFRRIRGTCMGVTVWQLNDIWPVASWASIDYYGRWKALQYAEKRMFAPVMISCEERGEIDQKPCPNTQPMPIEISATLHVANETDQVVRGIARWQLCDPESNVLKEGEEEIDVPAYGGTWLPKLDFSDQDQLDVHFFYTFEVNGEIVSKGSSLFCAPKHYRFADPQLQVEVGEKEVTVTSKAFAKWVTVESADGNLRLCDNFFDMEKGSITLQIEGEKPAGEYRVRSVYDMA